MSPGKVYVGEEGEGHSMLMDRKQKKTRELTVDSLVRGIWRLRVSEAERGERTGRSVKLKTVTEVRRSSAHDTFIV